MHTTLTDDTVSGGVVDSLEARETLQRDTGEPRGWRAAPQKWNWGFWSTAS